MLDKLIGQVGAYRHIVAHPLNAGRRWETTKRWLGWHIGSRLVPGSVAVPFVNDTFLLVDPGMTGATLNVYCGLAEPADMGFVLHALRPESLFLDVGANVGVYTVMASGAVGATSIAIEPAPSTVRKLKRNILINGISASVEIANVAVGDSSQTVRFTTESDTMNHVVSSEENVNFCEVDMKPLDAILAGRSPDVMKIDVEGYELPILTGASNLLRDPVLQAVVIELNGSGKRYGFADEDVVSFLVSNGFISVDYNPISRVLREQHSPIREGNNAIFVRDIHLVQKKLQNAGKFRINNGSII